MRKTRIKAMVLGAATAAMLLAGAQAAVAAEDAESLQPAPGHEQVAAPVGYAAPSGDEAAQAAQAAGSLATQSIAPMATSGSCGDNATWSYSSGTLTISGSGEMTDYNSSSETPWREYAGSVTKVVVEQGITRTGSWTFADMSGLTSVTLPNSLKTVGQATFINDVSLTSISLPGTTTIETGAFVDCVQLASVNAPNLDTLGSYAFQGTALTTYQVGKKLVNISSLAFFNCKIESYTVEAGNSTFTAKNGVLFRDGGKTLAFYPAGKADASFTIPAGVTKVGESAFLGASNLKSINLSGVTELGDSAFQQSGITSLAIPDSITSVGYFAFYDCDELESVAFGKGLTRTGYEMFEGCEKLSSISYGSLTELDARTFASCPSLVEVTLPASITAVGNGCFGVDSYETSGLKTFTSKGLTEIPYQCFLNCKNLTTVNLNEGVTTINRASFLGCSGLASITVPKSCTLVHDWAFEPTTTINCLDSRMKPYGRHGYRLLQGVLVRGVYDYQKAFEVLELVNQERAAEGLPALVMNQSLLDTAMIRAGEQSALFSHTRPDGSSCFELNSIMTAENVAYGQTTAQEVMNSWMNSEGHRANIMDSYNTVIGIGCFVIDGDTYWTQCFGEAEDTSNCAKPANRNVIQEIWLVNGVFEEALTGNGVVFGSGEDETYQYSFAVGSSVPSVDVGKTAQVALYLGNGSQSCPTAVQVEPIDSTWASSDETVATVSDSGVVTGKKRGVVDITAQLVFQSPSCSIRVGSGTVERLAGANRFDTMKAITTKGYDKADVVLIASGLNYADALAASGMCGVMNAPVLLTDSNKLSEQAASEIARLKPSKAYILGGTSAVSSAVESDVKKRVGSVQRIGGSTRTQTAVNIYNTTVQAGGTWGDTCILAKGWSYADALSAGSVAYVNHMPVFMAEYDGTLSNETREAVMQFDNMIVLGGQGGQGAIIDGRINWLDVDYVRLSGDNRYETAVAIADWATGNARSYQIQPDHLLKWDNIAFAYAGNFPDALAGVNVTGPSQSVTVLVSTTADAYTRDVLVKSVGSYANQIARAYVFGGTSVISNDVQSLIAKALE